jgi:hypothetical protein
MFTLRFFKQVGVIGACCFFALDIVDTTFFFLLGFFAAIWIIAFQNADPDASRVHRFEVGMQHR